jgi:phage shock protein C
MSKKLYRPKENRLMGGVCAGLAEYINLDVSLIRLLFIVINLMTTALFTIFYLICWMMIPGERK